MLNYEQITGKIITLERALELFTPAFRKKNSLVFTNGCFDLLHRGHVYLLARARELGDHLVVGLNSDLSVTRLKGEGRPVNDEQSRAVVLAALGMVDHIILFEEDTPLNLIKIIRPDILVKGGDYRIEEVVGHEVVPQWGGIVRTIPVVEGYSTTAIIRKTS